MAQQLDWMVLPNNNVASEVLPATEYTYDLYNLTILKALCSGSRTLGVNLTWGDPTKTDNIRFQKQNGSPGAIKFDEPLAIRVRGESWLVYQKGRHGVNLGWSDEPKFEWRIKGQAAGTSLISGNGVGLFSTVENDYLMYEPRDYGINLKWFKDSGKYDDWTSAWNSTYGKFARKAGEKIFELAV